MANKLSAEELERIKAHAYLRLEEVAVLTGMSVRQVRKAVFSGDLPALRHPRQWLVKREVLDEWMGIGKYPVVSAKHLPGLDSTELPRDDLKTYLVQSAFGGPIKIGQSLNPEARLASMRVNSPLKLEMLAVIEEGGAWCERELHGLFRHHRLHGEWFDNAKPLLEYLAELFDAAEVPTGLKKRVLEQAARKLDLGY